MGEVSGSLDNGRFRGEVSIWAGVAVGVAVGSLVVPLVDLVLGGDADSNTYDPEKLEVVEFFPEANLRCEGLKPDGSDEVLASTITCELVEE